MDSRSWRSLYAHSHVEPEPMEQDATLYLRGACPRDLLGSGMESPVVTMECISPEGRGRGRNRRELEVGEGEGEEEEEGCCCSCCSCCNVNKRLVPVKASYFFTLAGKFTIRH